MKIREYIDKDTSVSMVEFTISLSSEVIDDINSMNGLDVESELSRIVIDSVKEYSTQRRTKGK